MMIYNNKICSSRFLTELHYKTVIKERTLFSHAGIAFWIYFWPDIFGRHKRKITFTTAIALSDGKNTICELGKIEGYVSETVRGENGFGFDEIFELENGKTLAEISEEEKNEISARKIALEGIRNRLNEK